MCPSLVERGKHAKALLRVLPDGQTQENTVELCTPLLSHAVEFSVASRATSEAAPTLLFLPELPPEDDEDLGHEPDFIAALDGQPDKPCLLFGVVHRLSWR